MKVVFGLIVISLLVACSNSELKADELIKWVDNSENGLNKTASFDNYEFEATYKPLDYIIAMEARTNDISSEERASKRKDLEGLQYIDLKISTKSNSGGLLASEIESEDEYYQRLDYFVTYAQQDISLVQGTDTLSPKIYHFERNYGLAPYNTLLLGFDKSPKEENRELMVNDQILGIGKIKFVFEEKDLIRAPKLKCI